tara:strand:+ start:3187 stop:4125 length:939 start_codon:yes stop_codon:yes gene_type:complete
MARKQESEKFTGLVGKTTFTSVGFDSSNPTGNTKAFNSLVGADVAQSPIAVASTQPTQATNTPPFPNEIVWSRSEAISKAGLTYTVSRPQFHFDFTSPVEYGDGRLHNVGKIKQAKVVLNVKSVSTTGATTPTTGIVVVLMCSKQQPLIETKSKGGTTTTTYTLPRALQGFAIGGTLLAGNNLGSTLNIASTDNVLSTSSTGQIGFNLPPPMLRELERAMRRKTYFSVSVIEQRAYKGTIGVQQFSTKTGGSQTVTFYGAGSGNTSLQPILDFHYDIETSKLHTGAGASRISKAGFLGKHTIAGTSSGFGDF